MERWQIEHRTERELDAHGFTGDDEVPAILGDMEDEVRMEDLKPQLVAMTSGGGPVYQMRSRYDAERPPRAAARVTLPSGTAFDDEFLSEGEDDGQDEG